jgi:glycosyltransferase involved in cell wall biosynthesis
MKVGVNLTWLVPGVVGGTETYATGLLRALSARSSRPDIVLFALPEFADAYSDLTQAYETAVVPLRHGKMARVLAENSWLHRLTTQRGLDLVHHFGGVVPLRTGAPAVLTVHDLFFRHFPHHLGFEKRLWLRLNTARSLRAASVITSPSAFTAADVAGHYDVAAERITVIPPAMPPASVHSAQDATAIRERVGLGRYLLYPAALYEHKNHRLLLDAFARVAPAHPDVRLMLTGPTGAGRWGAAGSVAPVLAAQCRESRLADRVVHLGWLPPGQLSALYAGATALVFPSRFEGFGLPAIEAMAAGIPVLAARAGALPEVVAEGGQLLDPDDTAVWAAAIGGVLSDSTERDRLATAARSRAQALAATDSTDALVACWQAAYH